MEEWRRWLTSLIPGSSSIPRSTLAVLLVYSFSSQFLPIEPYFVPYITSVKKFSNHQVTVDIFPISVYSQLIFTLLMAPVCLYLSHKVLIILGAFGVLITYLIVWIGQSLLAMEIMQITYGFGVSARLVFSSYIFLLVSEEEYQTMTSLTTTTSLLSFMLASELGQLLAFQEASYGIFFVISLIALGICCAVTFLLPKDHSLSSISSLTSSWGQSKGWTTLLKETWHGRRLQIFSLWWAVAFAGISLVQNYGTNLFDAVDSKSKLNGHILAASEAAASLGSYCAIYIEKFASKSCLSIYILGSALMGILCVSMGISSKIWVTYCLYITICGIYQTLACLVSVRCGQLLSNGQYILLFSINSFAGLLIETLLQAAIEISGLSIFSQFISFAGFFFLATAICVGLHFVDSSRTSYLVLETEPEHHISDST
ncbi:thiamine transporter 2-like isoform X2 [Phoenix dactylifera]|uniref:Thiamine transporter 2-like isoform X2 n=1 Tax=Phoenix dactylifera TaxID=42345 RepID=A0A8B7CZU3_PHODC|nr:thiamine transporter 2-like isoform X2 [Phoenix dactylifera]